MLALLPVAFRQFLVLLILCPRTKCRKPTFIKGVIDIAKTVSTSVSRNSPVLYWKTPEKNGNKTSLMGEFSIFPNCYIFTSGCNSHLNSGKNIVWLCLKVYFTSWLFFHVVFQLDTKKEIDIKSLFHSTMYLSLILVEY